MDKTEGIARKMYDVYCEAVGGLAFNGDKLPGSDEFFTDQSKTKQANAWRKAAGAAIEETTIPISCPIAVGILIKHLNTDDDYRRSWADNISVPFQDEFKNFSGAYGRNEAVDAIKYIADKAANNFLDILCM